jgi:hypothetical protein
LIEDINKHEVQSVISELEYYVRQKKTREDQRADGGEPRRLLMAFSTS